MPHDSEHTRPLHFSLGAVLLAVLAVLGASCAGPGSNDDTESAEPESRGEFCGAVEDVLTVREELADAYGELAAAPSGDTSGGGVDQGALDRVAEQYQSRLIEAYESLVVVAPDDVTDAAVEMRDLALERSEAANGGAEETEAAYDRVEAREVAELEVSEATWEECGVVLVGPAGPRPDTTPGAGWDDDTAQSWLDKCSAGYSYAPDGGDWGAQYCVCIRDSLRLVTSADDAFWTRDREALQSIPWQQRSEVWGEVADGCLDEADFISPRPGTIDEVTLTVGDVEVDLLNADQSPLHFDPNAGPGEAACLADRLVEDLGIDLLARIGFTGATSTFGRTEEGFESDFEQFLNTRFPPNPEVTAFIDALLDCIDTTAAILTWTPDVPEPLAGCMADTVLADENTRLVYLYSGPLLYEHHPPIALVMVDPVAHWLRATNEYLEGCGLIGVEGEGPA